MAQKKGSRIFVWIIFGLLCIGLLGFGTGNIGGNISTIGTVGEKELRVSDYRRAIDQQISAFEAQTGSEITFADAEQLGIVQLAQTRLIGDRAIENEATQMGVSIGDEYVREEVLGVPGFRGVSGDFDREVYREALRRNGLTEADFEASIRDDMARTLLQGSIAGGLPNADTYARAIVDFIGTSRDIVWAEVTKDNLVEPIPGPSDEQLRAFYDENPDMFTAPEARDISYVWLTPEMIQDQITVDEETVRGMYDERIAEFVTPERRLVERLAYIDQAAADAAKARLDAGEVSFDDLVAERGLELSDIDLGDVSQDDLGAAADAVFSTGAGSVVGPVNSTVGPALFRVNAALAAQETPFDEAAPALRDELASVRAVRIIDDTVEPITNLMAGGAGLDVLAERTDMELGQISWSADSEDGIAAYEAFRYLAAATEEGAFPKLERLADGGVFALEINGIVPPTLRPYDEVAEEVRAAYDANALREAIKARADQIAAETGPLSDLASFGLTAVVDTDLTRRSFVPGTPPGFMVEVFDMDLGSTRVVDNGNTSIIVRVDAENTADLTDPQTAAEQTSVAETATAGIANDLYRIYAGEVQRRTDVNLNQNTLNAVHASIN